MAAPGTSHDLALGPGFARALLRSETFRIRGLLAAVVVIVLFMLLRALLGGLPTGSGALLLQALVLFAGTAAYEVLTLRRVRRALRGGPALPRWFWFGNAALECSIPAVATLILAGSGLLATGEALAVPLPLYAIFITLSTLRLRPSLTLFCGVVSAATALAATLLVLAPGGDAAPRAVLSLRALYSFPFALLVLGLVAAGVAARLRAHVVSALAEAAGRQRAEQELSVASRIQQDLLPTTAPRVAGFDIAGWNRPADETGGDYYDWQTLPDGNLLVTLADVTGHGLGPALVTAFCRAYARAIGQSYDDLHAFMVRLNRLVSEDLAASRFVTYVATVVAPDRDAVGLLSAGHGPLLHFDAAAGHVRDHGAHGVPLGILPEAEFDVPSPLELRPGDALVLLTDGFFEWARADGEQFGLDRLRAAVRAHGHRDARGLIDALRDAVEAFADGEPQQDDLTAVVIRRSGPGYP